MNRVWYICQSYPWLQYELFVRYRTNNCADISSYLSGIEYDTYWRQRDNRLHMYNDNECSTEGQITEYLLVKNHYRRCMWNKFDHMNPSTNKSLSNQLNVLMLGYMKQIKCVAKYVLCKGNLRLIIPHFLASSSSVLW